MKKNYVIAIICVCFLLCACSITPYKKEGLDQWSIYDSNVEITQFLFPDESFLNSFEYCDGDYHYFDDCKSWNGLEVAIAFTEYEDDVYLEAKQYCIDNMLLSEYNRMEYNGYVFVENLQLAQDQNFLENGKNKRYPYRMNMFVYNDSLNRLVFLGFYCTGKVEEQADIIDTDFGAFLELFYSDYYDFGDTID